MSALPTPTSLAVAVALLCTAVAAPVALADSWSSAGAMGATREEQVAAFLPDGNVLAAGGNGSAPASADLFDPLTRSWATGAARPSDMSVERNDAVGALLPDGQVLVAGG